MAFLLKTKKKEEHEGKGYESLMTVVKSRFRANVEDNLQELFCSELVALALKSLGVLQNVIVSNYLPSDFAQEIVPGADPEAFEAIKVHAYTSSSQSRARRPSGNIDATGITSPRELKKQNSSGGVLGLLSPRQARKSNSISPRTSAGNVVGALKPETNRHRRGKSQDVPKTTDFEEK